MRLPSPFPRRPRHHRRGAAGRRPPARLPELRRPELRRPEFPRPDLPPPAACTWRAIRPEARRNHRIWSGAFRYPGARAPAPRLPPAPQLPFGHRFGQWEMAARDAIPPRRENRTWSPAEPARRLSARGRDATAVPARCGRRPCRHPAADLDPRRRAGPASRWPERPEEMPLPSPGPPIPEQPRIPRPAPPAPRQPRC